MPGPDPAVAATRLAVREHLADVPEGGVVLVACSGGPDSRGARGGSRLRGAARGRASGGRRRRPRAAGALRRGGRGRRGPVPRARARPRRRRPRRGPRSAAPGLEADARSARYAAIEAVRRPASAPPGAHRPHARRPGRAGAARPVPRVGRQVAQRYAGAPGPLRPSAARPAARDDARCLRGATASSPGTTPTTRRPSFRRVRARRLLATLESDLGPGFAAALARSADLLREDADYLESLAVRARADLPTGPAGDGRGPRRARRAAPGDPHPGVAHCSPPRPAHRSPTSARRTSSRSTRCSPRGTVRARCTCPAASPSPAPVPASLQPPARDGQRLSATVRPVHASGRRSRRSDPSQAALRRDGARPGAVEWTRPARP